MNLFVNGLGMVSKIGDQEDVKKIIIQNDFVNPEELPADRALPIEIPDDFPRVQQLSRRMSHFAKISLLSACRAVKDCAFDITEKRIGIIQGSVYGPIISGLQAFDDLIDFGDNQLSPTHFSGSVFNTSATYLSLAFGIQGPTLSHTCGMDTLYNSLLSAFLWLENGSVDYVIIGIGDEFTPYFASDGLAAEKKKGFLPSCEGWTTLIVSKEKSAKYGQIEYGDLNQLPHSRDQKIIYSVWHEQMQPEPFFNHAKENKPCFPVPLRGSYPSAAAFDLALALICSGSRRFPVSNLSNGSYQMQNLTEHEQVCCYSISERGNLNCYRIVGD